MTSRKKKQAVAAATIKSEDKDEKPVDESKKAPATNRKKTRSATAAFGEDAGSIDESPARKKQNTSSSSSTGVIHRDQSTSGGVSHIAATSGTNHVGTSANYPPRDSDTDAEDEKKNEDSVLDLIPTIRTIPTKPNARETACDDDALTTGKSARKLSALSSPERAKDENLEAYDADPVCTQDSQESNSTRGILFWIGLLCLVNAIVFSVVAWSGLLLNERSVYQIELAGCREQLQQINHAMGLIGDGDDYDTGNGNRLREQLHYWQELEAQVMYWKKEAKKHQRYGEGFKEQCKQNLEEVLTEIVPQGNSQKS